MRKQNKEGEMKRRKGEMREKETIDTKEEAEEQINGNGKIIKE